MSISTAGNRLLRGMLQNPFLLSTQPRVMYGTVALTAGAPSDRTCGVWEAHSARVCTAPGHTD